MRFESHLRTSIKLKNSNYWNPLKLIDESHPPPEDRRLKSPVADCVLVEQLNCICVKQFNRNTYIES